MLSSASNLTKNDVEFLPVKILSKKVFVNNVDFSTIKITLKNVSKNNVDFSTREITSKKVGENNVNFSTIKLHRKKYVETTWIFRPAKLHWKKYVEKTWIFRSARLHRKSAWDDVEFCRNLLFDETTQYPRGIDVDSKWCARWVVSLMNFWRCITIPFQRKKISSINRQ